jgi:1-acyl-sn-glycerol-3-phosphate acyltransferase
MINRILKVLFFVLFVKPLVFVILGLNIRRRENLPLMGPAVIIANHNSHLDALVLMSLYPLSKIHRVRPVAAADYFLSGKLRSWFSVKCLGIIALDRTRLARLDTIFDECHEALDNNQILIIFPEGSRGSPERLGKIKKGVFYLTKDRKNTPIIPVVMYGLGKALPKGEALFVPFNCDVVIGDPMTPCQNSPQFTKQVADSFTKLLAECLTKKNRISDDCDTDTR